MNTTPVPTNTSATFLPEVCHKVAQGIRAHRRQLMLMGTEGGASDEEMFQIALEILYLLAPEMAWTGDEARAFADLSGLTIKFRLDDGWGIY